MDYGCDPGEKEQGLKANKNKINESIITYSIN